MASLKKATGSTINSIRGAGEYTKWVDAMKVSLTLMTNMAMVYIILSADPVLKATIKMIKGMVRVKNMILVVHSLKVGTGIMVFTQRPKV